MFSVFWKLFLPSVEFLPAVPYPRKKDPPGKHYLCDRCEKINKLTYNMISMMQNLLLWWTKYIHMPLPLLHHFLLFTWSGIITHHRINFLYESVSSLLRKIFNMLNNSHKCFNIYILIFLCLFYVSLCFLVCLTIFAFCRIFSL